MRVQRSEPVVSIPSGHVELEGLLEVPTLGFRHHCVLAW